jgi:hypothetical protein
MKANVTYRLLSLEFRGMKPRAMFNGARIVHLFRFVVITDLKTPPAKVESYLKEIDGREIKSIRYQIIATDPRSGKRLHPPVTFCHDVKRGAGVRLIMRGRDGALALRRDGGKPFFTDRYSLDEVMAGTVQSKQRCYQFDE